MNNETGGKEGGAMGGGNGLKSHMSQQKHAARAAAEGKGGGGASGKAERMSHKEGINCALCKTPFVNAKMKAALISHQQAKHSKNTMAECFPGIEV